MLESVTLLATVASTQQVPAPEVYTVIPQQPKQKKPGQLSSDQVEQFFEEGYVVVPSFLTGEEIASSIRGIEERVDKFAEKLYSAGKITDKCEKAGFYERLILLEKQFKGAAVLLVKQGDMPQAFCKLWSNERLLNVIEQFIGPNIAGHPVWNLRTKVPHKEELTVPWHQDNAYLEESALYTMQPTAWIPFIDTNAENGCMQVVRRGHRLGMTCTHTCCAGSTWYVDLDEKEMEKTLGVDMKKDVVTCDVPMGGILFLNNCTPHRSLENYSDKIRWSLDLRWQEPRKPNGFYGFKDCILMRTAENPDLEIDWEQFTGVDRTKLQEQSMGYEESEFDTTVHGPWMYRWQITNHNKHTRPPQANI